MSRIVAVFGVFVIMFMAVYGVSAVYEDAGTNFRHVNETFTPDVGNVTTLQHSHVDKVLYDDRVVVRDETGERMEPARDYRWFASNGTIKTLPAGRLAGDANATITYEYARPSEGQRVMAGLVGTLLDNLVPIGFAFVLVLFVMYLSRGP